MRYHTRINISPSGLTPELSATIGNLWAARCNLEVGRNSGGSFVVQFDDLLVQQQSIQYRTDRRPYGERVMAQLAHYGVTASPTETLAEFGVAENYRVMWESDCSRETDYAWRHVLPPQMWEVFGEWPPPFPPGAHSSEDAHLPSDDPARPAAGMVHPYVVTARVVMDALAGRNLLMNGDDCREARGQYAMLRQLLRLPPVEQYSLPLLRHTPGDAKISVSSDPARNPFYITRAIEAGVTYAELWGYLEAVAATGPLCQRDPRGILNTLKTWPVIDTRHWLRFLKAGAKRRQALIDELRG